MESNLSADSLTEIQRYIATICGDFNPDTLRMRTDVPATELTTFGLGHGVRTLIEPQSLTTFSELLLRFHELGIPWNILGAGSNVILPDQEVLIPTLRFGRQLSGWHILSTSISTQQLQGFKSASETQHELEFKAGDTVRVLIFSGSALMSLSRQFSSRGWSGLEFAAGIPASLGGAIRMNAGAHGSQMSAVVDSVFLLSAEGTLQKKAAEQLQFSYRSAAIDTNEIVVAAELCLEQQDTTTVQSRRSEALAYRKQTQPLHLPSAGSVFKNPTDAKRAAAAYLDELGFKGRRVGDVSFSEMHANWLVRLGPKAQAAEFDTLVEQAISAVYERYGIRLTPEIIRW